MEPNPPQQPQPSLARAGRNLAAKAGGEAVVRVCFFFLFVYAARALGADDFGRFSWAVSLGSLVLVGMELGLNPTVLREVARAPGQLGELSGASLFCQALAALVLLGGLGLGLTAGGMAPANRALVMMAALAHAAWGLTLAGLAGLAGAERMGAEATIKAIARMTSLAIGGGLLAFGLGYWGLLLGLGASNLLGLLLTLAALAKAGGFRPFPSAGRLKALLRQSLPLALAGAFTLAYTRLDMVMLEAMGRPFGELGWYAGAVRVLNGLANLPVLVAGALAPLWASLPDPDRQRLLAQGLRLSLTLGLPAGVGLAFLSEPVCGSLFGPAYAASAPALAWLCPAASLLFVNHLLLAYLAATSRQTGVALAAGGSLLLNFLLNLGLIPAWGYLGAGLATSLTEAALALFCLALLKSSLPPASLAKMLWPVALASCPMALFLWAAASWAWWARLLAASVIYAGALSLTPGFSFRELAHIRSSLRPSQEK